MRTWTSIAGCVQLAAMFFVGCGGKTPNAEPSGMPATPAPSVSSEAPPALANAKEPAPVNSWRLTAADSDLLEPALAFDGFEIRPPVGFKLLPRQLGGPNLSWAGPTHPDGFTVTLSIRLLDLGAEDKMLSLETHLQSILDIYKRTRNEWECTPIEHGSIQEIPFVRASCNGIGIGELPQPLLGKKLHNLTYLGLRDAQAIMILAQDEAPFHEETFKQIEHSLATFRPALPRFGPPKAN